MKSLVLQQDKLVLEKEQELGFMSRTLAQISLPHSDLKTNYFSRSSGLITLTVQSEPDLGLPYGTYPRLLLAWLCSEAVKTKSRSIHLGSTQIEFLKKLSISNDGRSIAALKNQCDRLLSSVFRICFADTEKNRQGKKQFLLAESNFELWQPHAGKWEADINLTRDFFEDVIQNPVPFDFDVLNALRKSPMAMDVYTWLVYRTYSIYVTGNRPVKISWADLQAQFGASYGSLPEDTLNFNSTMNISQKEQQGLRNFKKYFLISLQKIKQYYPELERQISIDSEFLTLGGVKLIK
jgi:hypothetical protein